MADLFFASGNSDRDFDKVLVALKKGAQLLKCGRKGKPKFCPFRVGNDETSLIWISDGKEKVLKLATVSKIIPGQRTDVFKRYSSRDKEYLSFSLIYKNGDRSLDLVCKDKLEAEVWFAGLKALIASARSGRSKIDGWRDDGVFDETKDLSYNGFTNSYLSPTQDFSSPDSSIIPGNISNRNSTESLVPVDRSDAANMHAKGSSADLLRVSVSSVPSTSSHGSNQDDCDSLGDVYIWGEIICDIQNRVGSNKDNISSVGRTDVLLPRPLESNTILDVQQVSCGVRHSALITRQGELFTWGEESGGCLGHGLGNEIVQPRLVESLAIGSIDFVACGEFHSCAVTSTGELYTWGDGTHHAGLLGHGNGVSHCLPKRVSGPLEGLVVSYVACGTWHTSLITSTGQLFTYGDGTFGALGHGNRESIAYPKEVDTLKGLRTLTVACGVWHTAAIVEVMAGQSSAIASSRKLFTWGDGDKYRLGHGDKEPRLKPTCVSSLIDYNFHRIACGHSLTVGVTTLGRIFTMGTNVYGQLGNPNSDGKLPCSVEDKLAGEYAAEVSCGSYHVAVLTTKSEVYTWGKGANGRLGHGDIEDRKTPTLVEALKDRSVKQIACGSNFTAAICQHKWVSGSDQSQCSSCRQPFGFTRKKHNCYNCGLVHCHSCSSKKALRAALSPNPTKPYRVCDTCYLKLNKTPEPSAINKKSNAVYPVGENKGKPEKAEVPTGKTALSSNFDLMMLLDSKAAKNGTKTEPLSFIRAPFSNAEDTQRLAPRAGYVSSTQSVSTSRAVSPFSRKSSPPRSVTPIPTSSGLSFTKPFQDKLKEDNEILNQQLQKLRLEVERLRQRCQLQELELKKSTVKAQEAMKLAAEESAKSKAAKEVMKSLTAQLKQVAERLPTGADDGNEARPASIYSWDESHDNLMHHAESNGDNQLKNIPTDDRIRDNDLSYPQRDGKFNDKENTDMGRGNNRGNAVSPVPGTVNAQDAPGNFQNFDNTKSRSASSGNLTIDEEWLEQYEPGVYITLVSFHDGTRDLKRVRFSRRRFGEHQAAAWWSENREKVFQKYNVRASDRAPTA